MKQLIFAIITVTILLAGCDAKKPQESTEKELLLYCGAGIRPPVAELAETFGREHGIKVVINYAGSEVLLSTIKLTRRGDLYMPGDKHYVQQAADEGMILSSKSVCYWVPTILVQKDNPKKIRHLEDLLRADIKLGLGDAKACAIGRKTKKIFAKNNIPWTDVEKNMVYQSLTVTELGMQIQSKALDAVIVWDATARYFAKYGDEVAIPVERNLISTIDIGVLSFTEQKQAAEKFVDFITSERGLKIFSKHNYRTSPPE